MKNSSDQLLPLLLLLLLSACGPETVVEDPDTDTINKNLVKSNAPDFKADSAFAFIQTQVNFGPRVPQTDPHAECADWLIAKLKTYGAEVQVQNGKVKAYNDKVIDLKNIIASFKPELKKRVLLAAHWDTRPMADRDTKDMDKPIDGANDGGSGVGVLLEIARLLQLKPLINTGIDIIFFDMEDYGSIYCQGSLYWSKKPHVPNYNATYGILLDMVGAKGAVFPVEGHSRQNAFHVVKNVWEKASLLGYSSFFSYDEMQAITDDHAMINQYANIPCIDIIQMDPISGDFGPFHHKHSDNMDIIDKATLKAVGQTVMEVIYSEK